MNQHVVADFNDAEALRDAFNRFNDLSVALGASYEDLCTSVESLTEELTAEREEKIRQLEEKEEIATRLSAVVDALPGGVVVVASDGVVVEANQVAVEMLGRAVVGASWPTFIAELSTESRASVHPSILSLADGRHFRIAEHSLSDDGMVLLVSDLTDISLWQETRQRQARLSAIGEMSARLAHQIRTPLAAALLNTSRLEKPMRDVSEQRHIAQLVRGRLMHIEELISSVLSYVRSGTHRHRLFPVDDLARGIRQSIEPVVEAAGGTFSYQTEGCTGSAWGSIDDVVTAGIAIAENAVAQKPDVSLAISLKVSATSIDISIEDDAGGIPDSIVERIFDPFFTTRAKGTGLGLAIVDAIVREHGGSVSVDNGPGGARFSLNVPRFGELRSDNMLEVAS